MIKPHVPQGPPQRYPRWITTPAGVHMIVKNNLEHSSMMGEAYGPDAELVKKVPPTMDELLAEGYSPIAAKRMLQIEQARAEQDIQPYGSNPSADFVEPPADDVVVPDAGSFVTEESAAPAVEVMAAHAADPLGIFSGPPEEVVETVETVKKSKKKE